MVPHLGPGCREEQPWIRSSGGEHPTAKDPVREGPAGPECQLFDDWSGTEAAGRRKYGMAIGASWSRPRVKRQDQSGNLDWGFLQQGTWRLQRLGPRC